MVDCTTPVIAKIHKMPHPCPFNTNLLHLRVTAMLPSFPMRRLWSSFLSSSFLLWVGKNALKAKVREEKVVEWVTWDSCQQDQDQDEVQTGARLLISGQISKIVQRRSLGFGCWRQFQTFSSRLFQLAPNFQNLGVGLSDWRSGQTTSTTFLVKNF